MLQANNFSNFLISNLKFYRSKLKFNDECELLSAVEPTHHCLANGIQIHTHFHVSYFLYCDMCMFNRHADAYENVCFKHMSNALLRRGGERMGERMIQSTCDLYSIQLILFCINKSLCF